MTSKLISVVSPVYNEEELIEEFIHRISDVLKENSWELILVDDGSTDSSFELISRLARNDQRIKPIKLSRNFGHQSAISCGIENALGDAVVVLDSDLQDPPEIIQEFIEKWEAGFEVVYGQRRSRAGESFFKRASAKTFYRFLNKFSDTEIPVDSGDFRLMDRKVVNSIKKMQEKNRYLRGIIAWVGFNQIAVLYDREKRTKGKTKYRLLKMLNLATDGLFSFSTKPLMISNWISVFFVCLAIFLGVYLIYQKVFYPEGSVPGFVYTTLLISVIASMQFFVIGIIGSYVGRIYKEVKNRPIYIEDKN